MLPSTKYCNFNNVGASQSLGYLLGVPIVRLIEVPNFGKLPYMKLPANRKQEPGNQIPASEKARTANLSFRMLTVNFEGRV